MKGKGALFQETGKERRTLVGMIAVTMTESLLQLRSVAITQ